jgi:N-carbamoyl-L-amino-acid hydrolase
MQLTYVFTKMHYMRSRPIIIFILFLVSSFYVSAQAITTFVNEKRIESRIISLSKFGKDSIGRGYRVAYTNGDIAARDWYINLMKKAGLDVRVDFAGNIIGARKGKNPSLKPIAFGSHIDMVPDGGNYDGCVGSIGALEVIEVLNENRLTTNHPLEVIIFSNEEGGTIGSMAMAGHMSTNGLQQRSQIGISMAEGTKRLGGNADSIAYAVRKKGDLAAFLELHIEQGGILDKEKIQIGVVEGIVGIVHWDITIDGFANHAGTTPMDMRKDALLAASRLVIAVNEVVNGIPGNQVGTIGKLEAAPGAFNVVPGKVNMGLELRDLSAQKIEQLFKAIEKRAAEIAASSGTTIRFDRKANEVKPALTDRSVQARIETAAKSLGFSFKKMQSGAGHDAQEISTIAPVGMIFIPSVNGISHSPKEFSAPGDMANGVKVLLQVILTMDRE